MILFIEYSMEELSLAQHIMVDWSYGMFNMVNRALMGLFVNFKKRVRLCGPSPWATL